MTKKRNVNSARKPTSQTQKKHIRNRSNSKRNKINKIYETREINYGEIRNRQRNINKKTKYDPIEIRKKKNRKKQAKLDKKIAKIRKSKKTGFFRNPKYRKQRAALFYIFIVIFLLVFSVVLSTTVFFKVEEISVSGQSNYSHEDIIKQSGITIGENLFLFNEEQVREKLQKSFPYISDVHVHKTLPSSVEIVVTQSFPDTQFEINSGFVVIDRNSRVLEIRNDKKLGCTLLVGANPVSYEISATVNYQKPDTQRIIQEIITNFNYNNLSNITQIDVTDAFNIEVLYDNRIIIELGNSTEIKYKIDMAATVMNDSAVVSANKGTLDVSSAWDDNKVYFKPDYN